MTTTNREKFRPAIIGLLSLPSATCKLTHYAQNFYSNKKSVICIYILIENVINMSFMLKDMLITFKVMVHQDFAIKEFVQRTVSVFWALLILGVFCK